jgi:mRNA turnover protein 4
MPKSRRDKVVALTQTKKKDREWKGGLIESVREALDEYGSVYAFRCVNLRNNAFKDLKADLSASTRFFMGSNKVLQVALGKTEADEQRDNLHKVSAFVKGHSGLVFTNLTKEDLETSFEKYETNDFARTGSVAPETVVIEKGPVHGRHGGLMEHTLEPTLRKNGMPTKLNRGVIELLADHAVCKEGEFISPQGAILLRLFGYELAKFKMDLLCGWVSRRNTDESFRSVSRHARRAFIPACHTLYATRLASRLSSFFGFFLKGVLFFGSDDKLAVGDLDG